MVEGRSDRVEPTLVGAAVCAVRGIQPEILPPGLLYPGCVSHQQRTVLTRWRASDQPVVVSGLPRHAARSRDVGLGVGHATAVTSTDRPPARAETAHQQRQSLPDCGAILVFVF
jgi:hypothetical protein